jgi:STE24 endopeptidase
VSRSATTRSAVRPSVWRPTPADPGREFPADELARARAYQRPLRRARVLRAALSSVLVVGFVVGEVGPRLVDAIGIDGWVGQLLVVLVALQAASLVIDVPIDAWLDFGHDRRWGLSTQTGRGFAADQVKSALLGLVLATALLVPLYAVVRATEAWWLVGWLFVVAASVGLGLLFPVVLAPLFNRFTPLADGELARRIDALAHRAGVPIAGVAVADASRRSTRDNAYVAGLGPTRRVVLYDTILEHPPGLVEQVVAHELGHWRRHHLRAQIPLAAALTLLVALLLWAFSTWAWPFEQAGVDGIGDPTGLPLLLLVVQAAGMVLGLVTAWVSRAHERQADLEALELLADPDAMAEMLRRLHVKNLADLDPGWWARRRASHPSAAERLAFCRAWASARSVTGPAPSV